MGVRLVPMFTTKNITSLGINHSVSLAPTVVTQTVQTTSRLIYCCFCVSVYIYNIYANVCEWVSVCTPRKCIILMLLTLLLFYTSHKPLASLLSHLFVEIFCGMSFCRCPGSFCSSLLFLCRGQFPTQMLVVFSASLWPCCALDHRGPEAPSSVCVIFLRPRAETICRAPDMVTSVSSSGDSKPEVCTNLQMVWG